MAEIACSEWSFQAQIPCNNWALRWLRTRSAYRPKGHSKKLHRVGARYFWNNHVESRCQQR